VRGGANTLLNLGYEYPAVGDPGAIMIETNTEAASASNLYAGTTGTKNISPTGPRGVNPFWEGSPETPLLPSRVVEGIPHQFGYIGGGNRLAVPENLPEYAFLVVRRFDDAELLGTDFVGFDGIVMQNLTETPLEDPYVGEDGSVQRIFISKGISDFEPARDEMREIGSISANLLPAATDWITLVPDDGPRSLTLSVSNFITDFSASGEVSAIGDSIYLISPKLQAEVIGGTANLLIGASAQRNVTITNINSDPAPDLSVTALEGDAVPSSFTPFTLAEEQSTTIGFSVVAASRGLISGDFHSNDVFEPVVEVPVGRAVAPESRLVDFPSLPAQLRAGQGISAQIVFGNVGDGNLSGLGESSNLRGEISATGSVGLDIQASGSINLPDGETTVEAFTLRVLETGESTFELGASFENGSQDGTNQPHSLSETLAISTSGPVPVIRWTDAEAAKQISDLESTGTLVIDSNATGGVPISISNEVADPLDFRDRLRIFSATLSGPDAGKFSVSGITNDSVIPTQTEDLTVSYTGGAATKADATLTLSTDYLAPGGANTVGETYVFQLSALTGGRLVTNTYVDEAGDFSPANPQINDIVTWKPGGADAVPGLVFGVDAFTSVKVAAEVVEENGTVRIAEGTFSSGAEIEIGKSMTIQGSGAGQTLLSGVNAYRVLNLTEVSAVVVLSDLGIMNGLAVAADENGGGGGILNLANLTINRCQLSGNLAKYSGGGIYNSGSLVIHSSTISGNTASGIFVPTGQLTGTGGGILNIGDLQLNNTTLSGNVSENDGGGINSQGNHVVSLNHCTVTKNVSRDLGGGIYITNVPATLTNCLVAGNTGVLGNDQRGSIVSEGANFIGEPVSASITGPGPVFSFASTGTSLGGVLDSTLRDNGGPTLTHGLVAGSPAIDAGSMAAIPEAMTTDQRGAGFGRLRGASVDLGSVEVRFDTYVHANASDFIITTDQGAAGLDAGDLVTWNGTSLGGPVFQLVFGVDAFTSIQSAADATVFEETVHIAGGTYLEGEEIVIPRDMTLRGDGANATILSGANTHRVLTTSGGSNISLTISDLTVSEGAADSGGGFFSNDTDLYLHRLHFVANTASHSGGAIALLDGRFRVYDCTFSNNSAVNGGAIWGDDSNARVFNTTFSGNSASENGGACYFPNFTVVIFNSTFAENSAGNFGGGVYNNTFGISMDNTILVGNTALEGPNVYSAFALRGEIISGEGNVINLPEGLSDISELLLPLGDYGGLTPTRALPPGSPAIDAGDDAEIPVEITADQRGFPRILFTTVDAGAVEYAEAIISDDVTVSVAPGLSVKIRIQDLIDGASGGVGTPIRLLSVSGPGNAGSSTRISGGFVVYQAPPGQTGRDVFSYVLSDGYQTSGHLIRVNEQETGAAQTLNIVGVEVGMQAVVRAAGVPGISYQLGYSDDMASGHWTAMGDPVQCPAGGIMEFQDPGPLPDSRFYRVNHVAGPQ
jgi:predicted outer membrane repeat protein